MLATNCQQPGSQQLQAHPGRGGSIHSRQRIIDDVSHPGQDLQVQCIRLPMQIGHLVVVGILAKHAFSPVSRQFENQQVADMG